MAIERIQQRRGTTAQWNDSDPILAFGEIGVEVTTTGVIRFKVGDDESTWTELPYFENVQGLNLSQYITDAEAAVILAGYVPTSQKGANNGVATLDANGDIPLSQLDNLINGAPAALDTLKEISDLLGDTGDLTGTLIQEIGSKADATHEHAIGDLTSFDVAGPIQGEVLTYNATTQKWENESIPAIELADLPAIDINDLDDVTISSAVDGNVLTYNSGQWVNQTPATTDLTGYVTETGTQTLTNKTLTAPTLNLSNVRSIKEPINFINTTPTNLTTLIAETPITLFANQSTANTICAVTLQYATGNTSFADTNNLAGGQSMTATVILNNSGSFASYINAVSATGLTTTTRWLGGATPTAGFTGGYDVYNFVLIRTGPTTGLILASQTRF